MKTEVIIMGKAPVKRIEAVKKFTDRSEPREAFHRILRDGMNHPDEFNVLTYYGIGGFGKTRLITELSKEIDETYTEVKVPHIIYDFSMATEKTVVIEKLENLLKKQGLSFPLTDTLFMTYNLKSGNPVYVEKAKSKVLDDPLLKIVAGFIPGMSSVLSAVKDGRTILEETKKYYGKFKSVWNLEEKKLSEEIREIAGWECSELVQHAASVFAKDLTRNTENASRSGSFCLPVVIFFDTYERLVNSYEDSFYAGAKEAWLMNDIVKQVPGVLWVFGGREKLNWAEKDPFFDGAVEEHELGDLSFHDSADFLRTAGIPETYFEPIYELTAGTPLFLDLSVNTYYEKKDSGDFSAEEIFGRNKEELIERFLRYMDRSDREIAEFLSILTLWTNEDAKILAEKFLHDFRYNDYLSFISHTIIVKDKEERYYMHETVRKVIFDSILTRDPEFVKSVLREKFDYVLSKMDAAESVTEICRCLFAAESVINPEVFTLDEIYSMFLKWDPNIIKASQYFCKAEIGECFDRLLHIVGENTSEASLYLRRVLPPCYLYTAQMEKAEQCAEQCLKDTLSVHADTDWQTVNAKLTYGLCLNAREKNRQAIPLISEALRYRDLISDQNYSLAINALALAYSMTGQEEKALHYNKIAYEHMLEKHGEKDHATIISAMNYAFSLTVAGDYPAGQEICGHYLKVAEDSFGKENFLYLQLAAGYAQALLEGDEFEKAREILEESVPLCFKTLGKDHPITLSSCYFLLSVQSYEDGLSEQVQDGLKSLAEDTVRVMTPESEFLKSVIYLMGYLFREAGKDGEFIVTLNDLSDKTSGPKRDLLQNYIDTYPDWLDDEQ